MKRVKYIAPVMTIDQAELQVVIAISLQTSEVEWKDDVDLEVKEQSDAFGNWEIDW